MIDYVQQQTNTLRSDAKKLVQQLDEVSLRKGEIGTTSVSVAFNDECEGSFSVRHTLSSKKDDEMEILCEREAESYESEGEESWRSHGKQQIAYKHNNAMCNLGIISF